jgi:hypothetical protein
VPVGSQSYSDFFLLFTKKQQQKATCGIPGIVKKHAKRRKSKRSFFQSFYFLNYFLKKKAKENHRFSTDF